jgi:hypothetical protein
MNAKLLQAKLALKLDEEEVERLDLRTHEIISLVMYSGPQFEYYNSVPRAMSTDGIVSYGTFKGQDVCDPVTGCPRFGLTIHAITHGVFKLSMALPSTTIYRGLTEMKLPAAFRKSNKYNIRGGEGNGARLFQSKLLAPGD